MNELTANPFAKSGMPSAVNQGAVAIEQERAIAEAQGKLVIAKRFPRDESKAYQKVMESCQRTSMASVANYQFPRGGKAVSGPSIRLAEEMARCWGNIEFGTIELSRKDGVSEMEAYAWDLETNTKNAQKFTVKHVRDKTGGGQKLESERDIYELTANQAARRLRARILAILPPDLVDGAVQQCRQTLAGNSNVPMKDRIRGMVDKFSKIGVTSDHIVEHKEKNLDKFLVEDIIDMVEIYNTIKSGTADPSDYFGGGKKEGPDLAAKPAKTETVKKDPPKKKDAKTKPEADKKPDLKPQADDKKQPESGPGDQPPAGDSEDPGCAGDDQSSGGGDGSAGNGAQGAAPDGALF